MCTIVSMNYIAYWHIVSMDNDQTCPTVGL